MSEVVESFGSGFVVTTVVRCGEGDYRWTRRPGSERDDAMRIPDPAVVAAVRTACQGRVRLTLPEQADAAGMTYRTDQPHSIAGMLLRRPEGAGTPLEQIIGDTFSETSAALARLHAVPLPQADLPSPEGPRRLLSWLRSGRGSLAAPDLHRHAIEILGHERMAMVGAWCVPGAEEPRVLLHGAPSQGILLPLSPGRDGHLLTGENLGTGRRESDVGWLIGELVEFRELARRFGHGMLPKVHYDDLIGRVLEGYATRLDLAAVGRTAAVRFLKHVHDFAAYRRWHELLVVYLRLVADVIDAADAGELLPARGEMIRR